MPRVDQLKGSEASSLPLVGFKITVWVRDDCFWWGDLDWDMQGILLVALAGGSKADPQASRARLPQRWAA